jgi:hypothetical protein
VASQPVTTAAARAGLEAGRNHGKIVVCRDRQAPAPERDRRAGLEEVSPWSR